VNQQQQQNNEVTRTRSRSAASQQQLPQMKPSSTANQTTSTSSSTTKRRREALSFLSNIPTNKKDSSQQGEAKKKKLQLSVDIPAQSTSSASVSSSTSSSSEHKRITTTTQQQGVNQHSSSSSSSNSSSPENKVDNISRTERISPVKKKLSPPNAPSGSSRTTTKKSTALQFLQNIPLKKTPKKNKQESSQHQLPSSSIPKPSSSFKKNADNIISEHQQTSPRGVMQDDEESTDGSSSSDSDNQEKQRQRPKLSKVQKLDDVFSSKKGSVYHNKVPAFASGKTTRKSLDQSSSFRDQKLQQIAMNESVTSLTGITSVIREDDSSFGETFTETEEKDDPSIRRCHLTMKTSGLPLVSCSYILPGSSTQQQKRKDSQPQYFEPTVSMSNDGFATNQLDIDCNPSVNGNYTSTNAIATSSANTETSPQTVTPIVFIKKDRKYTSYEQWFNQSPGSPDSSDETTSSSSSDEDMYDPLFLDDPKIRSATANRKIMHLPGLISSTVPFIKKKELETNLNEKFREKHPTVQLSLSKIRTLKKKMLRVCFPPTPFVNAFLFNSSSQESVFIECSTIALAVVYLEKLILKDVVTKANRRVVAATCLFLAFKMNYEGGGSNMEKNFIAFWESVEENLSVVRKQVLKNEFQVFAWLDFNLNISINELYPHLKRLLFEHGGMKVSEYMGEHAFHQYVTAKLQEQSEEQIH
jgi:hypothetical protein